MDLEIFIPEEHIDFVYEEKIRSVISIESEVSECKIEDIKILDPKEKVKHKKIIENVDFTATGGLF